MRGRTALRRRRALQFFAAVGVNIVLIGLMTLSSGERLPIRRDAAPPLYLDITPRARFQDEIGRSASRPDESRKPSKTAPARRPTAAQPDQNDTPAPLPAAERAPADRAGSEGRSRAMARSLSLGVSGCGAPELLNEEDRRSCLDRRGRSAAGAALITGTGDIQRDAAFARQGARRLQEWETRRTPPTEAEEPCRNLGPITECSGVNVSIDLFSTRDGFLPNQRKRRQ